ncbi:MAG: hypothetical protein J7L95_05070 [Prolixibacteraceae bacterium]|nr:hypothetical protein [Prolixibacteraceae bacterium]
MKLYSPLFIALRVIFYSLLMFGIAEAIFFDAAHPMEAGYFGEITLTEFGQELILFVLFIFYLFFGMKYRAVQPVANIVSLFFLISFIREFNFLIEHWIYPVLLVFVIIGWLVIRDFKKIKSATVLFFRQPASAWFFAGFLTTYIFSRLFGRSSFWRILYNENNYRLAKAAVEEGLELLGDTFMLIAAIEFTLFYFSEQKETNL